MKHTIHKWGVDISSIHEVIGPQYTSIPTNPNQKNENFHEKIKCLEQPKMQNKHQKKIFVVGVPTSRKGGGVKPVGTKSQVCQRNFLCGSPQEETWMTRSRSVAAVGLSGQISSWSNRRGTVNLRLPIAEFRYRNTLKVIVVYHQVFF